MSNIIVPTYIPLESFKNSQLILITVLLAWNITVSQYLSGIED